jgi:hypothetical protein
MAIHRGHCRAERGVTFGELNLISVASNAQHQHGEAHRHDAQPTLG